MPFSILALPLLFVNVQGVRKHADFTGAEVVANSASRMKFFDYLVNEGLSGFPKAQIPADHHIDATRFARWKEAAGEEAIAVRYVSFRDFIDQTEKQFDQYNAYTGGGRTCVISTFRANSGVSLDDAHKSFGWMRLIFKAYLRYSYQTKQNSDLLRCFGSLDPRVVAEPPSGYHVVFVIEDVSYSGKELMETLRQEIAQEPVGATVIATAAYISQYAATNVPFKTREAMEHRNAPGTYVIGHVAYQLKQKIEMHNAMNKRNPGRQIVSSLTSSHVSVYKDISLTEDMKEDLEKGISNVIGTVAVNAEVEVLQVEKCEVRFQCGLIEINVQGGKARGWIRLKSSTGGAHFWAQRKHPPLGAVFTWEGCVDCTFPRAGMDIKPSEPPIYFDHKMADEASLGVNLPKAMGQLVGSNPQPFVVGCERLHYCALVNGARQPDGLGTHASGNRKTCSQVLKCPYAPYKNQALMVTAMELCGCNAL